MAVQLDVQMVEKLADEWAALKVANLAAQLVLQEAERLVDMLECLLVVLTV